MYILKINSEFYYQIDTGMLHFKKKSEPPHPPPTTTTKKRKRIVGSLFSAEYFWIRCLVYEAMEGIIVN